MPVPLASVALTADSMSAAIFALGFQEQIDVERPQFIEEIDQVLQAAAEPVDAPSHHHIELASGSGLVQGVKRWPLVAALCAADAVVFVDLGDLPARPLCDLAQLAFLVGCGLIESADAKIKNSAFSS